MKVLITCILMLVSTPLAWTQDQGDMDFGIPQLSKLDSQEDFKKFFINKVQIQKWPPNPTSSESTCSGLVPVGDLQVYDELSCGSLARNPDQEAFCSCHGKLEYSMSEGVDLTTPTQEVESHVMKVLMNTWYEQWNKVSWFQNSVSGIQNFCDPVVMMAIVAQDFSDAEEKSCSPKAKSRFNDIANSIVGENWLSIGKPDPSLSTDDKTKLVEYQRNKLMEDFSSFSRGYVLAPDGKPLLRCIDWDEKLTPEARIAVANQLLARSNIKAENKDEYQNAIASECLKLQQDLRVIACTDNLPLGNVPFMNMALGPLTRLSGSANLPPTPAECASDKLTAKEAQGCFKLNSISCNNDIATGKRSDLLGSLKSISFNSRAETQRAEQMYASESQYCGEYSVWVREVACKDFLKDKAAFDDCWQNKDGTREVYLSKLPGSQSLLAKKLASNREAEKKMTLEQRTALDKSRQSNRSSRSRLSFQSSEDDKYVGVIAEKTGLRFTATPNVSQEEKPTTNAPVSAMSRLNEILAPKTEVRAPIPLPATASVQPITENREVPKEPVQDKKTEKVTEVRPADKVAEVSTETSDMQQKLNDLAKQLRDLKASNEQSEERLADLNNESKKNKVDDGATSERPLSRSVAGTSNFGFSDASFGAGSFSSTDASNMQSAIAQGDLSWVQTYLNQKGSQLNARTLVEMGQQLEEGRLIKTGELAPGQSVSSILTSVELKDGTTVEQEVDKVFDQQNLAEGVWYAVEIIQKDSEQSLVWIKIENGKRIISKSLQDITRQEEQRKMKAVVDGQKFYLAKLKQLISEALRSEI